MLCRKWNSCVCFGMLYYVLGKYEPLYCGLGIIKTQDMSGNRHIVSKSNKTTVGQKYKNGWREQE